MERKQAKARYGWQKRTSKKRNVPFLLSFEEWDQWWLSNGVDKNLPAVKNNRNTLCMCRYNDVGAYELSNIYCATKSQNSLDQKAQGRKCKKLTTPDGVFKSRIAAAQYYQVDPATINYRMKKQPLKYFYS